LINDFGHIYNGFSNQKKDSLSLENLQEPWLSTIETQGAFIKTYDVTISYSEQYAITITATIKNFK
jgi:hypothetical protein